MSHKDDKEIWTSKASGLLGSAESTVLVLIGIALVLVALLLLYAGLHDLYLATLAGPHCRIS